MSAIASRFCGLIAVLATFPLLAHSADDPSATRILDYTLRVSPARIAPDGFERVATVINGKMPGPLVKANKGDTLWSRAFLKLDVADAFASNINVINDLNNDDLYHSTSVHWHGIHMKNRNYNDGTSTVTQCPIIPNRAYAYQVPTNDQYGTFWYHSHFSSQYCDGLRGPLVVYNPNDPHKALYDIDDESTVLSLTDWYSVPSRIAFRPGPGVLPPRANSTLINGLGILHRSNGQSGSLAVINVQQNKRYRMRLISMSCDPNFNFTIQGHKLTVIEADSILVKSIDVDGLNILAGQRYSFVLNANQKPGNYWIRANPSLATEKGFANNINAAILRYKGAPIALPSEPADVDAPNYDNITMLKESALEPLQNIPVPGTPEIGKADISLTLPTTLNKDGTISLGNGTYKAPAIPILLQILNGARDTDDMLPQGTLYSLPSNKTIEITFPGDPVAGPHPFHLHGHDFWVVKSVDGTAPKWTNAIRRDTVSAGRGTNLSVTVRFRTDNPGPWFFHCHIDWHLDVGMGVIMVEDAKATANNPKGQPTKEWDQLCKDYNKYKDNGGQD